MLRYVWLLLLTSILFPLQLPLLNAMFKTLMGYLFTL